MNVVAGVQKIRVGQNGKTRVAQNNGRLPTKKTKPVLKSACSLAETGSSRVFDIGNRFVR